LQLTKLLHMDTILCPTLNTLNKSSSWIYSTILYALPSLLQHSFHTTC
jgi:hypothetical protein